MKIYIGLYAPAEGGIYELDIIFYEGEYWIVNEWEDNKTEGWSKPRLIVRLASLPHRLHIGAGMGDVSIPSEVPTASVLGPFPSEMLRRNDLVEAPDILFSLRSH